MIHKTGTRAAVITSQSKREALAEFAALETTFGRSLVKTGPTHKRILNYWEIKVVVTPDDPIALIAGGAQQTR